MANLQFSLRRADDGLDLRVETIGLTTEQTAAGWVLKPPTSGQAGLIAVTLGPQHVVEYADTVAGAAPFQNAPIFGPPSRVVFRVPPDTPAIPLSVAGVLGALPALALQTGADAPAAALLDDSAAVAFATRVGAETETQRRQARATAIIARSDSGPATAPTTNTTTTAGAAAGNPVDGAETPLQADTATSVSIPSRLILAIAGGATRFVHAAAPVTVDGRTELWHTRLAVDSAEPGPPREVSTKAVVRAAVPSTSFPTMPADSAGQSYRNVVDDGQHAPTLPGKINSTLTVGVATSLRNQTPADPLTMGALTLAPTGGSVRLQGSWPNGSVKAYRHRVVGGRDADIRVERRGRILPFNLEAILVTTTTRIPRSDTDLRPPSVLFTQSVLTMVQTSRTYPFAGGPATTRVDRQFPWQFVEALDRESPPGLFTASVLVLLPNLDPIPPANQQPANPKIGHLAIDGSAFRMNYRAFDRGGLEVLFSLPVLFVDSDVSGSLAKLHWLGKGPTFTDLNLGGQPVSVAVPGGSTNAGADVTTLVAEKVTLTMEPNGGTPAVTGIIGTSAALDAATGAAKATAKLFTFADAYLDNTYSTTKNPGELLLRVAPLPGAVAEGVAVAENAKALVSAGLAPVRGLSKRIGAVSSIGVDDNKILTDLLTVAAGKFDPTRWLADVPAMLFGVFPLRDLLAARGVINDVAQMPQQVVEQVNGVHTFTTSWGVRLLDPGKTVPAPLSLASLGGTEGQAVTLDVRTRTSVQPATQTVRLSTTTTVQNAELRLGPPPAAGDTHLVTLPIPEIVFTATDGAPPDVDVTVGQVTFGGPLSFVQALAALLAQAGFGKPARKGSTARALAEGGGGPSVDVLPDRVRAGLSIGVPDLAIGIFSLQDLAFSSSFEVFFNGAPPLLTLNFATIENPFRLSVSALAGGGFLGVAVSTDGLQYVKGKLEFGASVSVSLAGIAKGSASVMGGVYFELDDQVTLTGYLHIRGKLEVLCIVSVAVEVNLELTYMTGSRKVEGRAELLIKIKLFLFKKTVRFEVHRQFAGSNADPTFAELMAPDDWPAGEQLPWDAYCTAFAAD